MCGLVPRNRQGGVCQTARCFEAAMKNAAGKFDQLINTVAGCVFDTDKYLPLLKNRGNLHFCGLPEKPIQLNLTPVIFGRLTISGSPVGGKPDTELMLQFAAKHGIKPIIEEFKHSEVATAIQKVRDGSVRFRAVIKNDFVD